MGYAYAYGYGIRSGMMASQLYAGTQLNAYTARVTADGGIIQNPSYVYEWYKLMFELDGNGLPLQIRRKYNAMAGVKLNNILGVDYVQTWYDFGTTTDTRVDAAQGTAANQPAWATHATLPSGIKAPTYDGSNDFMTIADLDIFRNQLQGVVITSVNDFVRTAGNASHYVSRINNGAAGVRTELFTRLASTDEFTIRARRLDGDSTVTRTATSADGLNTLVALFGWGANLLQGVFNGTATASTTYSSGAGATSDTASVNFDIGSAAGASALNGLIPDYTVARILPTTAQLTVIRNLEKGFYPSIP